MSRIRISAIVMLLMFQVAGQSTSDEKITITFDEIPLIEALSALDQSTELHLSYNPKVLPADVVIHTSFEEKEVPYILRELLGDRYQLKHVGNYIIIQKAPVAKTKSTYKIKGGIRDASTGEELQDVSIYEVNSLQSTLSDEKGAFDMEAETSFEEATFVISKRFYQDTIIRVSKIEDLVGSPITLKQEEKAKEGVMIRERVRTFSSGLAKFFTSIKTRQNAQNVNFVDTRLFQASVIPSIGTNRKMSSQIRNNISLNLFSGYGYGVRGVEVGGLYNIDREEVRGLQASGFGNAVGGEVHGLQAAGFINTSKDYVNGAQAAGFFNLASDSVNGFQAAGFTNITRDMTGFQAAGFNNHTGKVSGVQISGFINTSQEMDGVQVAGFVNMTREVKGLQLAVINLADTIASGAPVGLINIVRKNGFISPVIESDEMIRYRLAMRTGIDKLYSILFVGIQPNDYWTYGAGFGSRLFLSDARKWYFNPEVRWFNISEKKPKNDDGSIIRLNLNVGNQLFKRMSITTGPSLSFYATRQLDETGNPKVDIASSSIFDDKYGSYHYQLWVGYSLGIGF